MKLSELDAPKRDPRLSIRTRPDPNRARPTATEPARQPEPAKSRITAPLKNMQVRQGYHRDHPGVDLVAQQAQQILAPEDGIVTSGRQTRFTDYGGMGTYIILTTASGEHRFMHLSDLAVTSGAVKQGQVIGLTGNTGRSTGPHLHWEYRDRQRGLIDPMTLLK